MYQQKRQYSMKAVLLVFALMISLSSFALSLVISPFSLATLDTATLCMTVYWFLSMTVAHQELSNTSLMVMFLTIASLEIYVIFGISLFLGVGVSAILALMIAEFHNWKPNAKYGILACRDILGGHAEVN